MPSFERYDPNDVQNFGRPPMDSRPHLRTRTASLLSVSSTSSFRSVFDFTAPRSKATATPHPDLNQAYGSFVPVASAAGSLSGFKVYRPGSTILVRAVPQSNKPKSKHRRHVTFSETVTFSPTSTTSKRSSRPSSPSPQIPYITRTFPSMASSPDYPPSPASSSSDITTPGTSDDIPSPSDLHPILAKLEKRSKFCSTTVYCSTCRKSGKDFPRCGKCGEMWCSRACRLVDGKRHVCSSTRN